MKRIGIYGGTFSPPHRGHLNAAVAFYDFLHLDELLIMPVASPPHKQSPSDSDTVSRLGMLEKTFCPETVGDRNISISRYEIERGGISYTSDTVSMLDGADKELWMLVGTDMLLTLESWHRPDIILSHASVALVKRSDDKGNDDVESVIARLREKYNAVVTVIPVSPVTVSSTEIRSAAAAGNDISAFVTDACAEYIEDNGLYCATRGLARLREKIAPFLSHERLLHTLSVENECAFLASAFALRSSECFKLRVAALLHDITHEKSFEEQLALLELYGIGQREELLAAPGTLHAVTGACFAADVFGYIADGEVYSAILHHTTGAVGMSCFDKLLCLSDYIEPLREYDSCRRLRDAFHLALGNCVSEADRCALLDSAMRSYFDSVISHLSRKKLHINSDTLAARDELVLRGVKPLLQLPDNGN